MVTDWRSGARASIAGQKPSGGWSAAVSCWPSKGDRRWPAPQPSPSRTTKTSGSLRPSKGGPVTDVADAAWLAELLEHGVLRGSFVPLAAIRELRDLTRYRKRLIQTHTAECQRIQKTLEDAGIKLDSVAADVLGASGRAMLAALVRGERDPQVLAELARGRLRTKLPQLRQALRGRFGDHHALLVGLALGHLEQLEGTIAALDRRVEEVIAPFARARDRLDTITGVGKRAAETIIAEIGVGMTVFPTAGHLASWAGRRPGNNRTGASAAPASPPRATAGLVRCSPSAPGPRPAAATATCRPSSGGWPDASARRRRPMAVGHS